MALRFAVLFPLLCALAAFIISFLALFAGKDEGFLEEYDIVRLNMSSFGKDLISASNNDNNDSKDNGKDGGNGGLRDFLGDLADDAKDKVADTLNDIGNEVADKLAGKLGISEWYSLHLLDACEGNFKPNATTPGAGLNVTNCTAPNPSTRINLTEIVDHELNIGPLDLSLADLRWPDGIQRQVEKLNRLLLAVFIFYCLAIGFSAMSVAASIPALLSADKKRGVDFANMVIAALAATSLLLGSAITTAAAIEGANAITDIGESVGVTAKAGMKFIALSWAAFALMAVATLFWLVGIFITRRNRKREFKAVKV